MRVFFAHSTCTSFCDDYSLGVSPFARLTCADWCISDELRSPKLHEKQAETYQKDKVYILFPVIKSDNEHSCSFRRVSLK